ncbi:MAG TPA: phosphotransferase [Pyrinomonadaceae bacterium]|jgi:aminoglycoside phosphotransferase (APT) family kinase protein|nr:phosphotransferase [Pyrinomonadaceae bacterium]
MTAEHSIVGMAPDPRLPQRDLLLDEREVARRLSASLGLKGRLPLSACERVRTKYRVGDSLRVLHRVRVEGRDYTIAARAFAAGESRRAYERASRGAVECAPLRALLHDAELETVFWTFPNDRKLSGLGLLRDVPPELARLFATEWTHSRLVAYAPEKCATAQCLDNRSRVVGYAKVYARDEGRRVYRTYRELARQLRPGSSCITLPRARAYDDARHTLLLEPVEGSRVADLDAEELPRGYRQLGAALATLHALRAPEGLPAFERLTPARVRRAALVIGAARPDVRREASELAAELERRYETNDGPRVCLHGDVHPKNFIARGGAFTLIDLDQCGAGDAAADLGSLLASLSYCDITSGASQPSAKTLGEAFLSGYASARALPATRSLRWHTAAALLAERSLRAVNRVRPEGLARLRELLAEASDVLREGAL